MSKIVITGASGFIGSHVAECFCSMGLRPACLVRNPEKADFLRTLPVDVLAGDILNPSALARVFAGAGAVIHTAAKVSDWGSFEDFYRVNVEGTRNVVNASIDAGARSIIITGSNSCYGEESSLVVKDEEHPHTSHYRYFLDRWFPSGLNHYRDTKVLACIEAMDAAARHGVNLSIIDPVWVYGEREFHSGFYDYLKTVRSGAPFFPGSAKNRFHTIYVRDLARLYFLVLRAQLTGVNRFIAADATAEFQSVLLGMFCREAGLRAPRRIPKAVVYPAAVAMEAAATLCHARQAPLLTRAKVNIFYDNIEYSAGKARSVLGFESAYSRPESIRKTVAWYIENKLL
jgi:nucleoside-diphosphate-sugar epimerase